VIIRTRGGLPYSEDTFQEVWRDVRKAAGIPKEIWSRDLRASGSTEARAAGAPIDDVKKLMGHTAHSETTAKVYDRAKLEAHRRIAAARKAVRSTDGLARRRRMRRIRASYFSYLERVPATLLLTGEPGEAAAAAQKPLQRSGAAPSRATAFRI
jgi:hypothetical protein